jgi:low affinity Fe/Cu permease
MNSKGTENSSLGNTDLKAQRKLIQGQLSMGKLIFLAAISLLLSVFGPLSLMAPIPLTMAFLLYGKSRALVMGLGIACLLWALSFGFKELNQLVYSAGVFSLALVYAYLIQSSIRQKIAPMKALIITGAKLLGFWSLLLFVTAAMMNFQVKTKLTEALGERIEYFKTSETYSQQYQTLKNSSAEEAKVLLDTLEKPEMIVEAALNWAPASLFVGTFFSLWLCLFIVMRNSILWRPLWNYPHTIIQMIRFRMPDVFVWPLIAGLVLFLGGEYIGFTLGEILGGNLLIGLSVFYFFQGFGIVIESLTYFGVLGIFRSLLLVFILFFAWRFVVLIGLFDTWINFRKFLKNKDEGDRS